MQQSPIILGAEGMILAKDVLNAEGRTLCGKGTTLDNRLVERLKRMEISHITVEGHPVEMEGEKSIKEEIASIEERFSRVTKIPPLMYLKKRLIEKMIASRSQS